MTTAQAEDAVSALPNIADVPLAEIAIDDAEYARLMRGVMGGDDGADTDVCAFNSSI